MVKSLPAMWETQVPSLGQEDSLEKEMATHSSILAWKIPWQGTQQATVHGVAKSWTQLSDFTFFHFKYSNLITQLSKLKHLNGRGGGPTNTALKINSKILSNNSQVFHDLAPDFSYNSNIPHLILWSHTLLSNPPSSASSCP